MSPPELAIWNRLRGNQLGVKFRKQHPIRSYIADFYCRESGLVIEVDGFQHGETQAAVDYDRRRDTFMEAYGLTVLRFTAHEIGRGLEDVINAIARTAIQSTLSDDLKKQWRFAEEVRAGDSIFGTPMDEHGTVLSTVTVAIDIEAYDIWPSGCDSIVAQDAILRGAHGDP